MGWSSGSDIFDPVTQALIDSGVAGPVVTDVCATLIDELRSCDWDTLDESVDRFRRYPAVIAAFKKAAPDWVEDVDTGPAPAEVDVRIEAEAWELVLAGAESHTEDAINEDPDDDLTDEQFSQVRGRAMEIIDELRTSKGVYR